MATTPLTVRIVDMLGDAKGTYTTAEIAKALDVENKQASSTLSRLVKQGKVFRLDNGSYGVTNAEETVPDEPVEDLIGETFPDAESNFERDSEPIEEEATVVEETTFKAGDKTVDVPKWKRKIALMLNKAERTDNAKERDAFMEAAERMMLRLGIHRAELEAVGEVKKEKIVEVKREWVGNYSIAMLPFVYSVAQGFGHVTILESTRSAMFRTSYVIGPESQVAEFLRLIDSLYLQVMPALNRWQRENRDARKGLSDMDKYIQHRSFITGFGSEVGTRLYMARQKEERGMSTGAELVVADRDAETKIWVQETYGEIGKARGGIKYGGREAGIAGREAGAKADINQAKVTGKKAVEA